MYQFELKTYISNSTEHYAVLEQADGSTSITTESSPFPESLVSFLYLDMEQLRQMFQMMDETLQQLSKTKDTTYADTFLMTLSMLPMLHFYFEPLFLEWKRRIYKAQALGFGAVGSILNRKELADIPERIAEAQKQVIDLIANVLDMDKSKDPVEERLTAYYKSGADDLYQFIPLSMNYEMVRGEAFAEALAPNDMFELISYHVRECIKREVKMRVCKNCGRYFAVTGHGGTEYCDRPYDERGRTCKEVGAVAVWNRHRNSDDTFREYRREYKKRFAWIKSGRITQDAFRAWSKEARQMKLECDAGKITADEYLQWLRES